MKKVHISLALLLGVVSLFFSCKNQLNLTPLESPVDECYLSFSIGNNERTVQATLTWSSIKEIVVYKDENSLASWKSDENKTAYQKMTSDDSVLLDSGTYDFKIDLKSEDGAVLASGTILQKKIEKGLNTLNFTTESREPNGPGNINLTFTWNKDESVTKATAYLYTLENTLVENSTKDLTLKTVENNTVTTYELTNIPSGFYIYKLKLYDSKIEKAGTNSEVSTEILTKVCADVIIIKKAITTTAEIPVTGINFQNQITYVMNGGSWASSYTPPYIFNENTTVTLPTKTNITKTNYMLSGWYDNAEFKGNAITQFTDTNTGNITLYAKWIRKVTNVSAANPGETVYLTSNSLDSKNSGPFVEWEVTGTSISESYFRCETIKKLMISNTVTSITKLETFSNCSNLEEVVLGTEIKSLPQGTFSRCTNLKKVTLPPGLTTLGEWTFDLNISLKEIEIPDSVTSIGHSAFQGCRNLEKIKLSKNLKKICYNSFENCRSLKSITIPASVTEIQSNSFLGCDSLTEVIYEGTLEQWLKIKFVSATANPCFYAKKLICNGQVVTGDIVIPNSIKTLSGYTFTAIDGITSITIPAGVTSIGPGFATGKDIQSIVVHPNNTYYDSRDNCNGIIETSTNTLISGAKITTIPDTVTKIGNNAYAGCYAIETYEFPPNITEIKSGLCSNLPGIKKLIIPNTVEKISDSAFIGCRGLERVEIPNSVTSIGSYSFLCCSKIEEIFIPSSISAVDYRAFMCCSSLKKVTISSATTTYTGDTFRQCINLETVILPEGTTSIPEQTFYDCEKLKNITIPVSVTDIDIEAFYYCTSLETIVIPENTKTISYRAFVGCSSLQSIEFINTTGWNYTPPSSTAQTYTASDPNVNALRLCSDMTYYTNTLKRE